MLNITAIGRYLNFRKENVNYKIVKGYLFCDNILKYTCIRKAVKDRQTAWLSNKQHFAKKTVAI